jgi:hypothetical protein
VAPLGAHPGSLRWPPSWCLVRPWHGRVSGARRSGVQRRERGAACENVAVPARADGWYPRSFVLTDIVDSVSLWERDTELMSMAIARHDAIIARQVAAASGELVRSKGEGDSTFSVFAHPAEAMAAAAAIRAAVDAEAWPPGLPLRGAGGGAHRRRRAPRG